MKPRTRRILYATLSFCCLLFAAFIFINGKGKTTIPALKERSESLAQSQEWPTVKAEYENLLAVCKKQPEDKTTLLKLAKTFMQEGRVTGNYAYYNQAALEMVDHVLKNDPTELEAICLKSMIFLSQHRFAEAGVLAEQARQISPYYAFVYGLICDSQVEMGNYPAAVDAADKMVSTRPDIRSYSRVSYLREIHGDVSGALEAIQLAISAGYPGAEDGCWARMVMAHLYEDSNALDKAEEQYSIALSERPDYPFALAGMGRIAGYRKDYPAAINWYEKARAVMADASFFEALIDLYHLSGQEDKAASCAKITIDALLADNLSAAQDKSRGHYSDMELAQLYLKIKDLQKAQQHAEAEYQRRPENIDACETLALVNYKTGNTAQAETLIRKALRTNSQKPERLALAGMIFKANGNTAEGEKYLTKARALKPYMTEWQ